MRHKLAGCMMLCSDCSMLSVHAVPVNIASALWSHTVVHLMIDGLVLCTDMWNTHSKLQANTISKLSLHPGHGTLTTSESMRRSSSHSFCHSKPQCEPPSVPTVQRPPDTWTCPGKRLHSYAAHKQSSHPGKHRSTLSAKHTAYHAETTSNSLLHLMRSWLLPNSQEQLGQRLEEYCLSARPVQAIRRRCAGSLHLYIQQDGGCTIRNQGQVTTATLSLACSYCDCQQGLYMLTAAGHKRATHCNLASLKCEVSDCRP